MTDVNDTALNTEETSKEAEDYYVPTRHPIIDDTAVMILDFFTVFKRISLQWDRPIREGMERFNYSKMGLKDANISRPHCYPSHHGSSLS